MFIISDWQSYVKVKMGRMGELETFLRIWLTVRKKCGTLFWQMRGWEGSVEKSEKRVSGWCEGIQGKADGRPGADFLKEQ